MPESDDLQLLNTSLATLGQRWDTEISLDSNACCTLVFDDDFEVLFQHNAEQAFVELYASLLTIDDKHRTLILEYALALNIDTLAKLGASMSIDSERRRLVAYTTIRLTALEPEVLTDQLSQFLSNAKRLQQRLRDETRAIVDASDHGQTQDQPSTTQVMMRV